MNLIKSSVLFIFIVTLATVASAESGSIASDDTLTADLGGGVYVQIPGQFDFTNFSISSEQMQFWLNNSQMQWRTNTNKTLTKITYNPVTDSIEFNASGSNGYLNFSGMMLQGGIGYTFYLDDLLAGTIFSNSDRIASLNYTGSWSDHNFMLTPQSAIYTLSASDVAASGALLHGNTVNLHVPVTVWFEWSASPSSYKYKTNAQTISGNGVFSSTLSETPVIANAPYYFRAVANDGSNTYYGERMSFTTLALGQISGYNFAAHFNDLINAGLNPTNMSAVAAAPFTDIFGNIFWGILFSAIFIFMWVRQSDITIPSLLGLIAGSSMWAMMPPDWVSMAMSLTIVSFGGLLYSLIKGRS